MELAEGTQQVVIKKVEPVEITERAQEEHLHELLKKVFEHLRNYLICGTMLTAGLSALMHPDWVFVGPLGAMVGVVVIIVAIVLAILNNRIVMKWISVNCRPVPVPGTSRVRGHTFGLLVRCMYLAFMYILVAMSVNISSLSR